MKGHFRCVVGWEKFAGQWLLRMKLADPTLKAVWPGSPSLSEPRNEVRLLADEVLTVRDLVTILTDKEVRRRGEYSASDLELLWQALSQCPDKPRGAVRNTPRLPEGPVA